MTSVELAAVQYITMDLIKVSYEHPSAAPSTQFIHVCGMKQKKKKSIQGGGRARTFGWGVEDLGRVANKSGRPLQVNY